MLMPRERPRRRNSLWTPIPSPVSDNAQDMAQDARAAGALVLLDLSHSVEAVTVGLNSKKADFAVGCGFKYLDGGPGAPEFSFSAAKHHADAR